MTDETIHATTTIAAAAEVEQQPSLDGEPQPGGWVWRYDLAPAASGTEVTLTYDWSAVSAAVREYISFPPFPVDHLVGSLSHLAKLTTD